MRKFKLQQLILPFFIFALINQGAKTRGFTISEEQKLIGKTVLGTITALCVFNYIYRKIKPSKEAEELKKIKTTILPLFNARDKNGYLPFSSDERRKVTLGELNSELISDFFSYFESFKIENIEYTKEIIVEDIS